MYKEIIEKTKPEFDKVLAFLEKEFSKIRAGRVSAALVEDVLVECFGNTFPLKQLGSISCPEPCLIIIQPWDKSYVEPIQKALTSGSVGAMPVVDKDIIRINLPPLSEEYRKELVKVISEKSEEARRTIRHWREEAWKEIQDGFKDGKIREDDKFKAKDELQKIIDEYHEKIDSLAEKKNKEIIEG